MDKHTNPCDKFGKPLKTGDYVFYYSKGNGIVTEKTIDVNYLSVKVESGKNIPLEKVAYNGERPNADLADRVKELENLKLYKCVYYIRYDSSDSQYSEAGTNYVLAHDEEEAKFLSAMNVPFDGIAWTSAYILSVERALLAQDENTRFWKGRPLKNDEFITVGDYRSTGQSVGIGVDADDCYMVDKEEYEELCSKAYQKK